MGRKPIADHTTHRLEPSADRKLPDIDGLCLTSFMARHAKCKDPARCALATAARVWLEGALVVWVRDTTTLRGANALQITWPDPDNPRLKHSGFIVDHDHWYYPHAGSLKDRPDDARKLEKDDLVRAVFDMNDGQQQMQVADLIDRDFSGELLFDVIGHTVRLDRTGMLKNSPAEQLRKKKSPIGKSYNAVRTSGAATAKKLFESHPACDDLPLAPDAMPAEVKYSGDADTIDAWTRGYEGRSASLLARPNARKPASRLRGRRPVEK